MKQKKNKTDGILEIVPLIQGLDFTFEVIKPDPKMRWHFTGGNLDQKKIEYMIDMLTEELESACLRQFRGAVTQVTPTGDLSAAITPSGTTYLTMTANPSIIISCSGSAGTTRTEIDIGDDGSIEASGGASATAPAPFDMFPSPMPYLVECTVDDGLTTASDYITIIRCPTNCGEDGNICDKIGVCLGGEWCGDDPDLPSPNPEDDDCDPTLPFGGRCMGNQCR